MTLPERRRRVRPAVVAFLAGVAACSPSPSSSPGSVRYVVGEPYSLGGVWSYPREDHGLEESGLATVLPDLRRGRLTANGEVHDPGALMAAHRTVQLPAVLRVWNLDTGREVRVRVNDRGPERPGRVIGLSRRAADLLGVRRDQPARVRIAIDTEASRAATAGLPGTEGPRLAIAAAPVAAVEREQLAPPPGARGPAAGGASDVRRVAVAPAREAPPAPSGPPARLSEEVAQRGVVASRLVVDAGVFFRRDLAERRAAEIGAVAEAVGPGRQPQYRVRLGPFVAAAEADRALEAALRRGIPDAKIVLE
ncbi:MAG: SPOR domain-containing protein [Acetobacteraceae bacterium]|nr:SPOR domain-containing protein [Acetobacteraceae bacterium]